MSSLFDSLKEGFKKATEQLNEKLIGPSAQQQAVPAQLAPTDEVSRLVDAATAPSLIAPDWPVGDAALPGFHSAQP